MSENNMKRLGDYIRPVDVRNRDLKVTRLMGINIEKRFMPSVANVVGTDLSNYKVVSKGQFACNLMHVGRDEKIPVALQKDDEPIIVSPAYVVFEVVDTNVLLTEYLMMWFSRSEFDRNAWFYTDGDVRGGMDRDALFDMQIPVPAIEKQREIVAEYNTLATRIETNKKLIATLEQTAQTLYRHTFVDNIDPNNLPQGWRMGTLTDVATYLNGLPCQKYETEGDKFLPVLKIRELSQGCCDEKSDHVKINIPSEFIIEDGDVIFSWSATLFIDFWCGGKCALNQHLFKVSSNDFPKWFYYMWTQSHIEEWKRLISAKATSMGHIKREDLETAKVVIPPENVMKETTKLMNPLFDMYIQKRKENIKLNQMQTLLLSKMGV